MGRQEGCSNGARLPEGSKSPWTVREASLTLRTHQCDQRVLVLASGTISSEDQAPLSDLLRVEGVNHFQEVGDHQGHCCRAAVGHIGFPFLKTKKGDE